MSEPKTENRNACQFFVTDDEAAAIRDITKVDALGPAALSIIRKVIEEHAAK